MLIKRTSPSEQTNTFSCSRILGLKDVRSEERSGWAVLLEACCQKPVPACKNRWLLSCKARFHYKGYRVLMGIGETKPNRWTLLRRIRCVLDNRWDSEAPGRV
jgi:hypothetical protein